MNFRRISHFIQIAECGSLSKAASRLGIVQPALSQSIRLLEEDLGVVDAGAHWLRWFHDAPGLERVLPGRYVARFTGVDATGAEGGEASGAIVVRPGFDGMTSAR